MLLMDRCILADSDMQAIGDESSLAVAMPQKEMSVVDGQSISPLGAASGLDSNGKPGADTRVSTRDKNIFHYLAHFGKVVLD